MGEAFKANISKERTIEELWLLYFNNYLYQAGVITEDKHTRMIAKILNRNSIKKE